jgi:ABC-type branched-subunit amino acid transport system ATPase component
VREALEIAHRAYILRQGAVVISTSAQRLLEEPALLRELVL